MSDTCKVQVRRVAGFVECGLPMRDGETCEGGHAIGSAPVSDYGGRRIVPPAEKLPPVERLHQGPPEYKLFSVDDHIIEPPDVWSKRVPAKYREAAPHVEEADGREYWVYEGTRALTMGLNAVAGKPRDEWTMDPVRYSDMIPGAYDPVARAEDMAADGVMSSVLFPSLPRFGGALFPSFADLELADHCVKAWNDFLFEEWCAARPEMFVPMPIVQLWDPARAADEIRRNAARGARAVNLPEETSLLGLPSYYSDSWDPVWDAVTECDLPVCMHIGSSGLSLFQPPDAPFTVTMALGCVGAICHSVSLMMSPVPRKYPTIKFVISEGGIGWVPPMLERADRQYPRHRYWAGGDDILPSEVCIRNFYWCMIEEPWGLSVRHELGLDHVMWECDYPHSDTPWPNSQLAAKQMFESIPRREADMITHRNAEKLFKWDCPDPEGYRRSPLPAIV
jgi:predicted TIM-barrel fold metal-dependent hydrolase